MTHHHDSLDPDHPHRCHCHAHRFPNVDVSCYPATMPLPFWSNPYLNASYTVTWVNPGRFEGYPYPINN